MSVVSLEQKLFSHDMLHILITCKLQRGVSCNPPKKNKNMKSNHHSSINEIAINVKILNIELKHKSMEKIDYIYEIRIHEKFPKIRLMTGKSTLFLTFLYSFKTRIGNLYFD